MGGYSYYDKGVNPMGKIFGSRSKKDNISNKGGIT